MDTKQRKPINIKDPALSPREIAQLMVRAENEMALVRVKDERNKSSLSLRPIWMAMKYFDFKNVQLRVDAEGYEDLQGMNPDLLYHNEQSLREQGLREISRDIAHMEERCTTMMHYIGQQEN